MNAFWTVIPLILIRYGLLSVISKESLKRASLFAPVIGKEINAYMIYQITTVFSILYLFLLTIKTDSYWFFIGLITYIIGIILYTISIINFSRPSMYGINLNGLYRISRNPMYVAYFIYFIGIVLLTRSWILLMVVLVFQISAHWIILSEERWCIEKFGKKYIEYMKKVRRYI